MRRDAQSLPRLNILDLYRTHIDVPTLRNLLQSFQTPPGSLSIRYCRGLDFDGMLDVITEHSPTLRRLEIYRSSTDRGAPVRFDYLASLPNLKHLYLQGDCLAWDSLQHIGPKVKTVTLRQCNLSASDLVASMSTWLLTSERAVEIINTAFDERQRSILIVSCTSHQQTTHSSLTFSRLAKRCPSSTYRLQIKRNGYSIYLG